MPRPASKHSNRPRVQLAAALWCGFIGISVAAIAAETPRYILQSNDYDPTSFNSQVPGRLYHWLGADAAISHLETGLAIDSAEFAGRGQRIDLVASDAITALQVKIKRIGRPGPLRWKAGSTFGATDFGRGEIAADGISPNYERFVSLLLRDVRSGQLYLQMEAVSGRCPDDYYSVYCTWREAPAENTTINAYDGVRSMRMMYRAIRPDPNGSALESNGREVTEGASMMTRLLTSVGTPHRRELIAGEEEPYAFVDALVAGIDPRRTGLPWADIRPGPDEITIGSGWQLQVASPRSPQVLTAIDDLVRFLSETMNVRLDVVWDENARPRSGTITVSEGPDSANGRLKAAGYRFAAGAGGIHLHGADSRGVLRAVWHLEDILMLRGGPFVRQDDRVREPRYSPRTTCAAWAFSGELTTPAPVFTDQHLSLISHYGYDAIWLGWYPGSDANSEPPTRTMPGRTPVGTSYRPFTSRLRDLAERAEKYDLQIVILYLAPHPADETSRRAMAEDAKRFLIEVPEVKTIVLLDEAMGSTRKGVEAWVNTCNLLTKAFHEARRNIDVVAWAYTRQSNAPDQQGWSERLGKFASLDPRMAFLSRYDTKWVHRKDGQLQLAYDYNISLRAPSVDFRHAVDFLTAEAQRLGHPPRKVWAKIESRISQESIVQPEIPCMQRWAERFEEINQFDSPPLSAVFANWSHTGFFPTPVTELFAWMSYTNPPPTEQLLHAIARRDFGPGQEELVVGAWRDFSDAIWNFPFYYGLSYPMNTGFAQPFWLDAKAASPRPWRRGFVNSLQTINLADEGGVDRGPGFPIGDGRENRARLAKLHEVWAAGLVKLAAAVAAAPAQVRARAEANWRNARSFGNSTEVTLRFTRWLQARQRLLDARTTRDKLMVCDELEHIGRQELAAARDALPMYLLDSKLGYMNCGRGVFTAQTIFEKIDQLQQTLQKELTVIRGDAMRPGAVAPKD